MFKRLGMDMSPFTSGEPFQYLGKMANGASRNLALKHPPPKEMIFFSFRLPAGFREEEEFAFPLVLLMWVPTLSSSSPSLSSSSVSPSL